MCQGKKSHYRSEFLTVCSACNAKLDDQNDVLDHITEEHCNSNFYECHLCRNYFGSRRSSLFQHQKVKHGVTYNYLACPMCLKFSSNSEKDVITHLKNVHTRTKKIYVCNYCDFESELALGAHFKEIHSRFVCTFYNCEAVCKNAMHLLQHYIDYHFPKFTLFFECSECNAMFPKKYSLYQHKRDKHGIWEEEDDEEESDYDDDEEESDYDDDEEESDYDDDEEESDYDDDEEESDYDDDDNDKTLIELKCPQCLYTTWHKNNYAKHFLNNHPDDFFNCTFQDCDYETTLFWSITQHTIDKHLSHKFLRYTCYVCEEISYSQIHSLIQHLRDKHSIVRTCSLCNTYEDDLSDHISSEPDHYYDVFSCRICREEYDDKYELVDHILYNHTQISPLSRSLCYG